MLGTGLVFVDAKGAIAGEAPRTRAAPIVGRWFDVGARDPGVTGVCVAHGARLALLPVARVPRGTLAASVSAARRLVAGHACKTRLDFSHRFLSAFPGKNFDDSTNAER